MNMLQGATSPSTKNKGMFTPMQDVLLNNKSRKSKKVVITIKQQAADGSMVPIPFPGGVAQPAPDPKAVYKAHINIDKKDPSPGAKRSQDLNSHLIGDLIKELHQTNTSGQNMNTLVQGMGLDPALVDQIQSHPLYNKPSQYESPDRYY